MGRKEQWIRKILAKELEMFLSVRARDPVTCQQDPEGFRVMRGAQFSVWSEEALLSYWHDLERAEEQGRNLMTQKYARMEGLISSLHEDPFVENLIERIVAVELQWQKEMMEKVPHLMRRGRPLEATDEEEGTTSFVRYLRGELETYSIDTLVLRHRDTSESHERRENLTEAICLHMVRELGYASLAEAEAAAVKSHNGAGQAGPACTAAGNGCLEEG